MSKDPSGRSWLRTEGTEENLGGPGRDRAVGRRSPDWDAAQEAGEARPLESRCGAGRCAPAPEGVTRSLGSRRRRGHSPVPWRPSAPGCGRELPATSSGRASASFLSSRSTFKEFAEKYGRDQRFRLVQKRKDQEHFFNQFILILKKRDKENRLRLRKMR